MRQAVLSEAKKAIQQLTNEVTAWETN
jgi:hypothetical protein